MLCAKRTIMVCWAEAIVRLTDLKLALAKLGLQKLRYLRVTCTSLVCQKGQVSKICRSLAGNLGVGLTNWVQILSVH